MYALYYERRATKQYAGGKCLPQLTEFECNSAIEEVREIEIDDVVACEDVGIDLKGEENVGAHVKISNADAMNKLSQKCMWLSALTGHS